MFTSVRSANMGYASGGRSIPIVWVYRQVTAKALIGTFLTGILLILIRQYDQYVTVLDLWDKHLMLLLNFCGSAYTDHFWYAYSQKDVWMPLATVTLWYIVRDCPRGIRDKIVFLIATILLVVFLDQLSSGVIKPLVGRLRPSHDPTVAPLLHYVNGYKGGLHGFVSGHATVSAGIVTWVGMIYKDWLTRLSMTAFSAMLCYSRIYLGVHYPGDILCGAFIGVFVSWYAFRFLGRKIKICQEVKRPYLLLFTFYITLIILLVKA